MTLGEVLNMKEGDIIPITITDIVQAQVDGVPVMDCTYGKFNGQYALRVEKLLTHSSNELMQGDEHG